MCAKKTKVRPGLVFAGKGGEIYDTDRLLMVCVKGGEYVLPGPADLTPLPRGSELFALPNRRAVGLDPETGELVQIAEQAVAAFVSPAYTLAAHAAYDPKQGADPLPLFAYAPVGYARGRFWVAAKRMDEDVRQVFEGVDPDAVKRGAHALMREYPDNRLVRHLSSCALTYGCPAARNLALGRFEAPLPTSRACNARCVGCISDQPEDSGFPATQNRIVFTPSAGEIVEVMAHHAAREPRPVFSFGQGCEGEPLTEAGLIAEATAAWRDQGGGGTVNVNTNASLPAAVDQVAAAGVDSIRVSINSFNPGLYQAYYRPRGYSLDQVRESISRAKSAGVFVSLNLLFFPGVTDTEGEFEALREQALGLGVDYVQMRNLNLDPGLYLDLAAPFVAGPSMGLANFAKRLKKAVPGLELGYFNPYLERTPQGERLPRRYLPAPGR